MANLQMLVNTIKTLGVKAFSGGLDANGNPTGSQVTPASISAASGDQAISVNGMVLTAGATPKANIPVTVTTTGPASTGIINVDVIAGPNAQANGPAQIQSMQASLT